MISTLKFLLRAQRKCQQPPQKDQGFTLIELLVSMILAVLVIGPLLAFMLNILETDRREQAKSISEQEVQQALDYITQDVAQAVYIYDADGLTKASTSDSTTSGIKDQIPPGSGAVGNCPSTATCTPVLVFWKREFLPDVVPVTSGGATVGYDDTYVYSLVAYYLVRDNSSLWSQAARITRFQIQDGVRNPTNPGSATSPNYLSGYTPSNGFQLFDLSLAGSTLQEKMNRWKKGTTAYNVDAMVLVDYIDQTTGTNAISAACPTGSSQTPPTIAGGFYACVSPSRNSAQVFIRGNALARMNRNTGYSSAQAIYFPTSSVQVQGRGLLSGQ
jgi:type II secretory pathway pseudopilin PulG